MEILPSPLADSTFNPSDPNSTVPGDPRLTRLIPSGAVSFPFSIRISPPIIEIEPLELFRLLPVISISAGLVFKNPKADGGAVVRLLVLVGSV